MAVHSPAQVGMVALFCKLILTTVKGLSVDFLCIDNKLE